MLAARRTEVAFYKREEVAAAIRTTRADPSSHRVVPVHLDAASAAEPRHGLTVKHGVRVNDGGGLVPAADRLVALLTDLKTSPARRCTASARMTPTCGQSGCHRTVARQGQHRGMEMACGVPFMVDDLMPARRSLRVAVVTETYPPEINGVAATIARVVEGLRGRGHEVQLVRPRQDQGEAAAAEPGFAELLMRGLPIPRYPQLKLGLPARRALLRQWTTHRPDVVHVVTEGPLGWSALQAASHLRLPVVSDFRTNFHAYSQHYGVAWLRDPIMAYLRKFHNRTACTMVPTETLRNELRRIGFRRLRVVSRGVDTRLFDPVRRSMTLRRDWGAGDADTVVISVGRLAPEKNLGSLVDAFRAMREQDPGMRLVLVGDGPDRARLQQRCPEAIFAGVHRGEDLAMHYASADVFLFPSLTETFGNVLPEAMASGLAVVGHRYAAAAQLLQHDENGLLVPYGDNEAFVAAARSLAGRTARIQALGRAARAVATTMDWARVVAAVESEYLCAMADGGLPAARQSWVPVLPAA